MPGRLLAAACAALFLVPMVVTGHEPVLPAETVEPVDLASALAPDGTFQGAVGMAGSVDAAGWSLVSDLAAGEAPRFKLAAGAGSSDGPWSALGSNGAGDGAFDAPVWAVAVSGTDIYVAGDFTDAAGIATADYVAKWNGSGWSALGSDGAGDGAIESSACFGCGVTAIVISGADVFVGGDFTDAAGIPEADNIARWTGSAWAAVGSNGAGDGSLNGTVLALAGSGTDIYAGGLFTNAGGSATADYVARWNGSAWSALGSNGSGNGALNLGLNAIAVAGSNLYVGGGFTNAAGIAAADYVARWNGSAWSALGSNGSGDGALDLGGEWIESIAVSGTNVYVGGYFWEAAGIPKADHLVRWDGGAWSALGSGETGDGAFNSSVWSLMVFDGDLYVGGVFDNAGGALDADRIARWSDGAWSTLTAPSPFSSFTSGPVLGLAITDDGLYATGDFQNAAGIAEADYVVKWNLIPFGDIYGNDFVDDIIWIYQEGITAGCTPTLYCPNANVTREQMASFLVRAMDLPATGTDYFTDDEASGHEPDINSLRAAGITFGCTATTFCPAAKVSREQMASFLVRALDLPATGTDYFTDDEASGHEPDINSLRASEITFGCTATTYCPGANVTRGQMAAFLHRAFGP